MNAGSNVELTETTELFEPAVLATDMGGGSFRILIGTFRFTAGLIGGETTTIRAADIPDFSDDWITGADGQLDDVISAGRATITVNTSAVPEPSSAIAMVIGLLGAGGFGLAGQRRRSIC